MRRTRRLPIPFLTGLILAEAWITLALAQSVVTVRPTEGLRERTPQVHALTHARIVVTPQRILENATLLIRNGRIIAVGKRIDIPPDAVVHDYAGRTITPGFIDAYAPELLAKDALKGWKGTHWNARVMPERSVADSLKLDEKQVTAYRKAGFTAALVAPRDGVIQGQSALLLLSDGQPSERILVRNVAQHIAFRYHLRFPRRPQDVQYPTSLMGAIALIRQTLYDAQWYQQADAIHRRYPETPRPERSPALAALIPVLQRRQPVIFETTDIWNLLRAARIIQEFNLRGIVVGSGMEYQRIALVRATGLPVIAPVRFPEPPSVEDPARALSVSMRELMHWDRAPDNPKFLEDAGIPFALTAHGLKRVESFRDYVLRAIRRGLSRETALAALTTVPARLLGVADRLGTLEPGKIANFIVSDGDIFDPNTTVQEVWIEGNRFEVTPSPERDPRGTWRMEIPVDNAVIVRTLVIEGTPARLRGKVQYDEKSIALQRIRFQFGRLVFVVPGEALEQQGFVQMAAVIVKNAMRGVGFWPDGRSFQWQAIRTALPQSVKSPITERSEGPSLSIEDMPATAPILYPFGAYGRPEPMPPQPTYVLVKNATIWTNGPQGILQNADLLVERGKIKAVGRGLRAPKGALIIDATGKHVTPGLVDAHSHTAIAGGVNEFGQAVSAEVRIQDVIYPDDVNLYRQLAGGVTTALLLHGSANPIGGQSQVIKLRWGGDPNTLIFAKAPPTIKFALGENPKQSNWGDAFTTRYPQTRMGVEQLIRDRFKAARAYKRSWDVYRKASRRERQRMIPPRRDLELEALVEILEGKRRVHAHSYRQDEILMLIRVANDFGFRVQCFQHVLEGYKIAEAIAQHGAGASTFSDWWAYKFEVYDAIPYNGALMWQQGVVVSFNSDSSELARRLNWEAAKAVKYGDVPEEEALKFVTLNPAKQLGVDRWVGSLEPGKDADFVIWSGHPFALDTVAEQTWIDGRKYFDREEDQQLRENMNRLRTQLIQKALKARRERPDYGQKRPETRPTPLMVEPYSCHEHL